MQISSIDQFMKASSADVKKKPDMGSSFQDLFKNAIEAVNNTDDVARKANYDLASGNIDSLHSIMIDTEKADIALQFTLQIRNKVMDAYNEIMRMQI